MVAVGCTADKQGQLALPASAAFDPSATSAALPAWLAAISWWAALRIADGTFLREHGGLEGVQLGTAARLGVPLCPPAQNSVAWRDALGERSTNGQGGRDYENIADRYRADRGHRDCGGAGSGAWQQERSRGPGAARAAERAARQGHAGPFELPQCRASGRQGGSQCARTKDGFRGEEEIAGV